MGVTLDSLGIFSIWNPDLEGHTRPLQIGSRGVEIVDYLNAIGIVGCGEVGEIIKPHLVAQVDRHGLELAGIQNQPFSIAIDDRPRKSFVQLGLNGRQVNCHASLP